MKIELSNHKLNYPRNHYSYSDDGVTVETGLLVCKF